MQNISITQPLRILYWHWPWLWLGMASQGVILTDNGTQFTPARAVSGPFTQFCENRGIKHILGRVHHPQTNGIDRKMVWDL